MSKKHCSRVLALLLIGLSAYLASCAPIQVKTDYDHSIDFSKLQHYRWIPNEQPDLVDIGMDKVHLDQTVKDVITGKLNAKGYVPVSDNADFLVSYYLVINAKTDVFFVNQYYTGIGLVPESSRTSARDSQKIKSVTYEQGILIVDILDGSGKQRIWRGYAQSRSGIHNSSSVDPQLKRIKSALNKILNRFPP